jgi:GNAT superfamily N-acetyltransferase
MTVVTRAARGGDVESLARFWYENMNHRPGLEGWRTIAHSPWYERPPNHGWIAVEEGRIVGAMALLHSNRKLKGRNEKLCNIGSLYVLKSFRGRGLAKSIARESTADETVTYLGIDAAPQTRAVLEPPDVGFRILDDSRFVWRPQTPPRGDDMELAIGDRVDRRRWPPQDRRLLDDHRPLGMLPLTARAAGRECRLILWVRNKSSSTLYYEIFYASDYECLGTMAGGIADRLIGDGGVLAVDARFFCNPPPDADKELLRQPRHYKSSRLAPADIDLLYCEVPLLGLKIS